MRFVYKVQRRISGLCIKVLNKEYRVMKSKTGDVMKPEYCQRAIDEAEYIISRNATVRECAAVFGVGKSTVHTDVTKKLKYLDKELFEGVSEVLKVNLSERHLRGGISTKKLYEEKKTRINQHGQQF